MGLLSRMLLIILYKMIYVDLSQPLHLLNVKCIFQDKVAAEVENGSLRVEGSNDVLTEALGMEESCGHVWGIASNSF